MKELSAALFASLLIAATAAADAVVPDAAIQCIACHGPQLMGDAANKAPRLSGMAAWYVEKQLDAFQKGRRIHYAADGTGRDTPADTAAPSAAQTREIAAFVAETESVLPPATIEGNAANGEKLYSTCGVCHGAAGEGNIALGSPALTGLNDWYLVTQLQHFRNGTRGATPGDLYGAQMRSSAGLLADDDAIRDVVTYISNLQDNQAKEQ